MEKKGAKIGIFVAIVILTILILGKTNTISFGTNNQNQNKNVVSNTNSEIIKDAKLKGLDLTNISLTYTKDVGSTFAVSLTNNTNEVIRLESFNIIFKDENGNTLAILSAYVGGNVDPRQVNSIKVTAKEDLSKAASVEYSESN